MENGEIRRSTHIDQNNEAITKFVDEVIEELERRIGGDSPPNIHVSHSGLESEFQKRGSGVINDNVLTIVWHNDIPAALVLATRDGFNYTNVQAIFLGDNPVDTL